MDLSLAKYRYGGTDHHSQYPVEKHLLQLNAEMFLNFSVFDLVGNYLSDRLNFS